MKTTDFVNTYVKENPEDTSMVVNNLHTIMRVTADLARRLKGDDDLDEWIKEKIAVAKSMMATVEDYIASQQEIGSDEVPGFNIDRANDHFARSLMKEEASIGATGSPSVAIVNSVLGEKGSFSKKEVNKKLSGYGNQLTRGGPVKIGKK